MSAPLAHDLRVARIIRQHDMIADTLHGMCEGGLFSARDAGIIIPSGVVRLRLFNLPYLTAAELTRESKDVALWVEAEPDIGKLEDPYITYHTLLSSETDDVTSVVVGYAEMATLRP